MSFVTDKQTLDDLNLPGQFRPGSVFGLFNRTQTAGGEKLLEELFRNPLSDPQEINRRGGLFHYLRQREYVFPFNRESFGVVEDYLGTPGAGLLPTMTRVLWKHVLEGLVKDEGYQRLVDGVRETIGFLHGCRRLIGQFAEVAAGGASPGAPRVPELLADRIFSIRQLLDDPRLAGLPQGALQSLSWKQAAKYHSLFCGTLRNAMERLRGDLYHLDVFLAVGAVARENDFCFAHALPADLQVFRCRDLRHPCLKNAIGNSLALGTNSNVLFLTGANMAGKSTFMKSFGIAVYLAHIGFPVVAEELVFSVKEGLFSSINVPDNISQGYSHFYAEVQRVKTIAMAVSQSKNLVVIFDELFKGTNVKDAYDATLAVTEAFSEYGNCFFVISTHITEVGEALQAQRENIAFVFLPTMMEGSRPEYTYRLEAGISTDRHGMMIIRNEGILELMNDGDTPVC